MGKGSLLSLLATTRWQIIFIHSVPCPRVGWCNNCLKGERPASGAEGLSGGPIIHTWKSSTVRSSWGSGFGLVQEACC